MFYRNEIYISKHTRAAATDATNRIRGETTARTRITNRLLVLSVATRRKIDDQTQRTGGSFEKPTEGSRRGS